MRVPDELNLIEEQISESNNKLADVLNNLRKCHGFNVESAKNGINEMCATGILLKGDICKGRLSLKHILERLVFYNNLAASSKYMDVLNHLSNGNAGADFDKYYNSYKYFVKKEVDPWLYAKTIFSESINAGKMNLKNFFSKILSGDLDAFTDSTAKVYTEYYIAKYLEDMYTKPAYENDVFENTKDYMDYIINNPKDITEFLNKMGIDKNSPLGQYLSKLFEALDSDTIKTIGKLNETGTVISDLIKKLTTDYSEAAAKVANMKEILSNYGNNERLCDCLDELLDKYTNDSVDRTVEYIKEYMTGKATSTLYNATLGKFTALIEIPADLLGELDSDIDNLLELRFTDDLASGLKNSYNQLSEKIKSGDYTINDLELYSDTFNSLKDMYIYRYERMIALTDDTTLREQLTNELNELRNMTL